MVEEIKMTKSEYNKWMKSLNMEMKTVVNKKKKKKALSEKTKEQEKEKKEKKTILEEFIKSISSLMEIGKGDHCEELDKHCIKLEIVSESDLLNLFKNSDSGKCDFYSKCKNKREECGCNLGRSKLLSLPDTIINKTK